MQPLKPARSCPCCIARVTVSTCAAGLLCIAARDMTDKKSERKGASGPVTSVPSETASAAPRARDASAPFAALKGIFHSFMVKDPEVRSPYYLGRDEHGRTDLSNNLARQMDSKAKLKDAYEFQRCEKLKSYAIQNGAGASASDLCRCREGQLVHCCAVGLVKYMLRAMKRQGCPGWPCCVFKVVVLMSRLLP